MSQEPEVRAEIIRSRSGVIIAIIGLIGGILIAILTPLVTKWVNQPTPTGAPTSYSIENFPQQDFAYSGAEINKGGMAVLYLIYNGSGQYPNYLLDYNIPEGQPGYAGLAFQFTSGQNVAGYDAIEFTVQFSDFNIPIDFYVKDISGQDSSIRITSSSTDKMNIRYALTNFSGVNFNALREIGFNSDNTFSTGRHTINVSNIRFVH